MVNGSGKLEESVQGWVVFNNTPGDDTHERDNHSKDNIYTVRNDSQR